jgi:hypothetical protein
MKQSALCLLKVNEASVCKQLAAFPPTVLSLSSSTDQWLLVDYSDELTFLSSFGALQQQRQFSVWAPQLILQKAILSRQRFHRWDRRVTPKWLEQLTTQLQTRDIKQSHSWEAYNPADIQKMSQLLWYPMAH